MTEAILVAMAGARCLALPRGKVLAVLDAPDQHAVSPTIPALKGMIAFTGAPMPVIDLTANGHGPVVVLQIDGHPLGCRVDAIAAADEIEPDSMQPLDEAALTIWRDLPCRAVQPARQYAPPPPTRAPAKPEMLNLRLGGQERHIPLAAVERLLAPDEATLVAIPGPFPPPPFTPMVLLYAEQAIAMIDLGCAPSPLTPLVLSGRGGLRYAFAAETVLGVGDPAGELLELPVLADGAPAPAPPPATAYVGFLEVVLGGRAYLLPLNSVIRVLPSDGRDPLPGLRHGVIRAVSGRVIPGLDIRPALGLSQHAPLLHDIVLDPPGASPCFLSVEGVPGLRAIAAPAIRPFTEPAGLVSAVVQNDGDLLWQLSPDRLLAALQPA